MSVRPYNPEAVANRMNRVKVQCYDLPGKQSPPLNEPDKDPPCPIQTRRKETHTGFGERWRGRGDWRITVPVGLLSIANYFTKSLPKIP